MQSLGDGYIVSRSTSSTLPGIPGDYSFETHIFSVASEIVPFMSEWASVSH